MTALCGCVPFDGARSSVVRVRDSEGRALGTGTAVAADVIVTCAHVVVGAEQIVIDLGHLADPEGARGATFAIREIGLAAEAGGSDAVASELGEDLAIVRVDEPMPVEPAVLVEGVLPALLRSESGRLRALGFSGAQGTLGAAHQLTLRGAVWTSPGGCVSTGQVDGGIPHGLSGGPLLLERGAQPYVLGMFYLGGVSAGQSSFYGSDVLIEALRRLGVQPRVRAAAELWAAGVATKQGAARPERLARGRHLARALTAGLLLNASALHVRPAGETPQDDSRLQTATASAAPTPVPLALSTAQSAAPLCVSPPEGGASQAKAGPSAPPVRARPWPRTARVEQPLEEGPVVNEAPASPARANPTPAAPAEVTASVPPHLRDLPSDRL